MKPKTVLSMLLVATIPLLSGCVSDAASLQIDGKEHSLSIVREQKWIWENRVELFVVVTRMPDCQRRHRLKTAPIAAASFDVFSADFVTYYLKQGVATYSVETKTCETFRELSEAPPAGLGQQIGSFREVAGKFSFVELPAVATDSAASSSTAR